MMSSLVGHSSPLLLLPFRVVSARFDAYGPTAVVLYGVASYHGRKRQDGSSYYTAQVVIKRRGKVYREARSFDRRQAASSWIVRREEELRKPGVLDLAGKDPKLADVIDRYVDESPKKIGRTKAQVLRTIKDHDIAEMRCSQATRSRPQGLVVVSEADQTPKKRRPLRGGWW